MSSDSSSVQTAAFYRYIAEKPIVRQQYRRFLGEYERFSVERKSVVRAVAYIVIVVGDLRGAAGNRTEKLIVAHIRRYQPKSYAQLKCQNIETALCHGYVAAESHEPIEAAPVREDV